MKWSSNIKDLPDRISLNVCEKIQIIFEALYHPNNIIIVCRDCLDRIMYLVIAVQNMTKYEAVSELCRKVEIASKKI